MRHLSEQEFYTSIATRTRASRQPESVLFELTYGCNLRCLHCYNPTHRALPQELTTGEILSILEQLAAMGVVELHVSGGEPFTRPDAQEIYAEAKRRGLLLHLLSNATLITPTVAERLRQLDIDGITVSIYGASQAVYETVTGVPGSYRRFRDGLACLAASGLAVIVRMPVMTANAAEVQAARTLVEDSGFKFQYSVDIIPKVDGDCTPLQHRLTPTEKIRIDGSMGRHSRHAGIDACPRDASFISCSCGRNRFAITPYGEMNLCAAFPIPKYDLRRGTVREGWEVLKQTVDRATPSERYECPRCDVRTRCRQGRSDAWLETGDMSVCLPHYKELAVLEAQTHEPSR
jgi:radical SAM protein with 4Fe4S-binding SPASM domain